MLIFQHATYALVPLSQEYFRYEHESIDEKMRSIRIASHADRFACSIATPSN